MWPATPPRDEGGGALVDPRESGPGTSVPHPPTSADPPVHEGGRGDLGEAPMYHLVTADGRTVDLVLGGAVDPGTRPPHPVEELVPTKMQLILPDPRWRSGRRGRARRCRPRCQLGVRQALIVVEAVPRRAVRTPEDNS